MIAAITAGGRVSGALADAMGTDVKALAPFAGTTLLDLAIDAARASGAGAVVVIGGPQVRARCATRVDQIVAEAASGRDNVRLAMRAAADDELLLLTSDLPFVSGEAVTSFLGRARAAQLAVPLASERDYLASYPGAPPHVTRIGRERVASGSAFYFAPGIAPRALDASVRLFGARKSLTRMAVVLGPALLTRFVAGRLTIEHVEARAQSVLGIRARAVRGASPALCYDVDTLEDYRYALDRAAAR